MIKVSTIGKALAFSRSTGHPVVFIAQGWCGQLMQTRRVDSVKGRIVWQVSLEQ